MLNIHTNTPLLTQGAPLDKAHAAIILLHGRGGSAEDMLSLAEEFGTEALDKVAYLAPQAANASWYPYRFNELDNPDDSYLISALDRISAILTTVAEAGIPLEKTVLLGFSQGASLTLEYSARHAGHFGGVVALSGGLIGRTLDRARYSGNFAKTPIFLGCSDVDPFIPLARVKESAAILKDMGGSVTEHIYPNTGHAVNPDELVYVRNLIDSLRSA